MGRGTGKNISNYEEDSRRREVKHGIVRKSHGMLHLLAAFEARQRLTGIIWQGYLQAMSDRPHSQVVSAALLAPRRIFLPDCEVELAEQSSFFS